MQVRDIATMCALAVAPQDSVSHVAEVMKQSAIGILPVEQDGKLLGVVTDRDIVTRAVAEGLRADNLRASDVMTPTTVTIPEEASVVDAISAMTEHRIRRLIVVDRDGRLAGVLSVDDLALQGISSTAVDEILRLSSSEAVLEPQPSFLS